MKISALIQSLTSLIVSLLFSTFAMTAIAQNYYPAEIGNEWILDSTDGTERQTYTLEVPEDDADKDLILLKIETKNLIEDKVIDTDKYFLTDEPNRINLHKTILQQVPLGTTIAELPTPMTFFPKKLEIGINWEIKADASLNFNGVPLTLKSISKFEVVALEPVETSIGTIQNCAKIRLHLSIIDPITTETTSYQWLAPNIGPVKFQNNDGDEYLITSFKRSPPELIAQNLPVWELQPNQSFQGTGSRLGGIVNARILVNVEDYVSEPDKLLNLGIESITGNIVPLGDGTGFATNFERKQDLWVAGRFENAPIIGTITLFAENSIGKTTHIINVSINVNQ